jgi:aspartyl-tRNA(Asn)/glutamyl-tRNA(Gln) amidotransferase subunit A
MSEPSLTNLGVTELGQLIKNREISPVDIVHALFERIRAFDHKINSFICHSEENAIFDAKQAETEILSGSWRGPLHGIPFAAKDLIDVAGIPTTAASQVWKDFIPREDATVVQNLKRSGAILVGKLNMHELAFGITSKNPHSGNTYNPWDLSASCGGSSSGSAAALAAGFVPLTIGTDTGGSIRIPSSMCGTVGLKPTYGLVSRKGVLPLAWSMDHVGPMARNVQDLAIALPCMTNKGHSSSNSLPPAADFKKLVIGVPKTFFYENLRDDIRQTVLLAIDNMQSMGAQVREIKIPGIAAADRAAFTILFSEAASCLESHARKWPQKMGKQVMDNVLLGMTIPATRYIQALRVRSKIIADLKNVFSSIDLLVVPATTVDAHHIDAEEVSLGDGLKADVRTAMTRYMRFFNLTGNPVLCLPCGFSSRNLPVGLQMVCAHFQDDKLLEIGSAYQSVFPLEPAVPNLRHFQTGKF